PPPAPEPAVPLPLPADPDPVVFPVPAPAPEPPEPVGMIPMEPLHPARAAIAKLPAHVQTVCNLMRLPGRWFPARPAPVRDESRLLMPSPLMSDHLDGKMVAATTENDKSTKVISWRRRKK